MIDTFFEIAREAINSVESGEFYDILRRQAARGLAEVTGYLESGNIEMAERAAAEWLNDLMDVLFIIHSEECYEIRRTIRPY